MPGEPKIFAWKDGGVRWAFNSNINALKEFNELSAYPGILRSIILRVGYYFFSIFTYAGSNIISTVECKKEASLGRGSG